jgi:hypothetical protein
VWAADDLIERPLPGMAANEVDDQHAEVQEIARLLTALLRERSAFDHQCLQTDGPYRGQLTAGPLPPCGALTAEFLLAA